MLFGPSLAAHVANSSDPLIFNDDVRQQIWPFFRYYTRGSFPDDFIGTYYLHAFFPLGYRAVFTLLAYFVDPAIVSKIVPYLCLAILVIACALTARRLGGTAACFAAGALCLSSAMPLERMTGGLPRAFGFPIVALALYALANGRVGLLAGTVVVGTAFYPPAAAAPGVALLAWLIILRRDDRGTAWPLRRRVLIAAGTTACSVLLLLPMAFGARAYGRLIAPTDVAAYPEAGPGGRYAPGDRAPFPDLLPEIEKLTLEALQADGAPFVISIRTWACANGGARGWRLVRILLALTMIGCARLAVDDQAARRGLFLAVAAGAAFIFAKAYAPFLYLPRRHLVYAVPVLIWVLLPCAAAALGKLIAGPARRGAAASFTLIVTGVVLLFLGGRVGPLAGLTVQVPLSARIYGFLATLPETALVAGWPEGVMDNVPYLSRRQVLLSYETHQAFHTAYADEMRQRMRAVVEALFALDEAPIVRLHDEFHVTHLLVDLNVFGPHTPQYFLPFTAEVSAAHQRGRQREFILEKLVSRCAVFQESTFAVVDLTKCF